jgi:membrane-associated protease RseP (regulator of RpoE activity)
MSSTLAAIGVLALLIVVHELGHFLAARLQGIYANRFSIGFGPILLKYQGPETEYAIRAFPLGGFVGFPEDDPESDITPDDPNLLQNRPILDRAIVISAGVIANLIFAYFVLATHVGLVGVPSLNYEPGVTIPKVMGETTAAAQAGLQSGDLVLGADGLKFGANQESVEQLVDKISDSPNQPIQFLIQRDQRQFSLEITPELSSDGKGRIGVQLAPNATVTYRRPHNPVEIFTLAGTEFQQMSGQILQGFQLLLTDFKGTAPQVASPVKIVAWGANIAETDSGNLFSFAALISINLAIINILPLPALDGGQLAFLLIEGLRGKPLPSQWQENIMQTGLIMLLGLGIFLIIRDTTQLPWIQQFFQQ